MKLIDHTLKVYDCSSLDDDQLMVVFDEYVSKLIEILEKAKGKFLSNLGDMSVLCLQLHLICMEMNKREPDTIAMANNYFDLAEILTNLNINTDDKNSND